MYDNDPASAELNPSLQAPLPWLTGNKSPAQIKQRPIGLEIIVGLLCTQSLTSLFFTTPRFWHSAGWILFAIAERLIGSLILWNAWKGRNWARVWLMIGAIFSVLGWTSFLLHKQNLGLTQRIFTVVCMVIETFLLFWLSQKPIVRFFKASGDGVS